MHESDASAVAGGASVKVYPLNQRTGAVTNTDNSDSDFSHSRNVQSYPQQSSGGKMQKLMFQSKLVANFN